MRIRATVTEHDRVAGKDYSVPFYIGCRLIRWRHAKFIAIEGAEPEWRPAEPLCVPQHEIERGFSAAPQDRMVKGAPVRKGSA